MIQKVEQANKISEVSRLCPRWIKDVINKPDREEMDEAIIERHNSVIKKDDEVIHLGDFTLEKRSIANAYLEKLNGNHVFIAGSHDRWLPKTAPYLWQETIRGQSIIACHYAMRVWPKSHHNSWQVYGHSHGLLDSQGKQWDVGVDNNDFYPVSFEELVEIMKKQPDNFNLVR